jgi:hypothetical protein
MLRAIAMLMVTVGCASAARSREPVDPRREAFVADSLKAAECKSTLSSSRIVRSSAVTDAFVRVHASYRAGDTVSGATLTSKKPQLSVQSRGDGIIRIGLPADSIPHSHVLPVAVRLIGFKAAMGMIEIFPGDTVDIEVRFCPQPLYLHHPVTTT